MPDDSFLVDWAAFCGRSSKESKTNLELARCGTAIAILPTSAVPVA